MFVSTKRSKLALPIFSEERAFPGMSFVTFVSWAFISFTYSLVMDFSQLFLNLQYTLFELRQTVSILLSEVWTFLNQQWVQMLLFSLSTKVLIFGLELKLKLFQNFELKLELLKSFRASSSSSYNFSVVARNSLTIVTLLSSGQPRTPQILLLDLRSGV